MWYWLPITFGIVTSISLLLLENKRVEAKGKPQLQTWAEQNGYRNLICSIQDCAYLRGSSWWRVSVRPAYGFSVQEKSGDWRYGHAVCDLSTREVTIEWHAPIQWPDED